MGNDPPIVVLAPGDRPDGAPKDTALNIRAMQAFVVNIVDEALAEAMNVAATPFPPGTNELAEAGLTTLPSVQVAVPRDVASRAAKKETDDGRGVGPTQLAVYLDFTDAIRRLGREAVEDRYGNLFEMYERITADDPYGTPMKIYPAPHYSMGGLWVDYNLMSNVAGLYVIGEANFSDHGANRLGASALMQGLADGYFVLPYTIGDYLSRHMGEEPLATDHAAFRQVESEVYGRIDKLLSINGSQTVDFFHRELGRLCWDLCGMSRHREGLLEALERIPELRERYWREVRVAGSGEELNQSLEKAGRVADFMELAELMCRDALEREESCGAHLRLEHQTAEGEAMRNDEEFAYVAAWEFTGAGATPRMHKEELEFENVPFSQRSYK